MLRDVKPGGIFLVNCQWTDEEFDKHFPVNAKRYAAQNNISIYLIDAIDLAAKVGMGKRTNTVLQSAFFALAHVLPVDEALKYLKMPLRRATLKKARPLLRPTGKPSTLALPPSVNLRFPKAGQTRKMNPRA